MSIVDEGHPVTLNVEAPLAANGGPWFRDAVRREIAAGHEECLRWFCWHPETPDDVLLEIYESGLCRHELGHRQQPRTLVEKMADDAQYPEAILTLAIQLYTDPNERGDAFEKFARRHSDSLWMLDTLVRRAGSSSEKETILERIIAAHPQAGRLAHLLAVSRWTQQAAEANDPRELERLYATKEPKVWLALAGNHSAPRSLLEQLVEVKGVRLARRIRNRAKEALGSV